MRGKVSIECTRKAKLDLDEVCSVDAREAGAEDGGRAGSLMTVSMSAWGDL